MEVMEDVVLADNVMDRARGAAIHGTILHEDGRNGSDLPVLHNITIENIIAHGSDYGIFLEAFDEVPVTGLTLRNIHINGVVRPMRSMNWKEPVVDDVIIDGKSSPRSGGVRILGVPVNGETVKTEARACGGDMDFMHSWQTSTGGAARKQAEQEERSPIPGTADLIRVTVTGHKGNTETSHEYRIFPKGPSGSDWGYEWQQLYCRGMWEFPGAIPADAVITREQLAGMLLPLADPALHWGGRDGEACSEALRIMVENGFVTLERRPWPDGHVSLLRPDGHVTRQEMATAATQAYGVNYRNASYTMPICADAALVNNNYSTNVARVLHFGFMNLEPDGCFKPRRPVTIEEAAGILNRVADFAGI